MTIELSDRVAKDLECASRSEGVRPDELAERLLSRALALEEFKRVQRLVAPYAKAAGFESEDDFFKAVS